MANKKEEAQLIDEEEGLDTAPILTVPTVDSRSGLLGEESLVPGSKVVTSKPVDDEDAETVTVDDLEDGEEEGVEDPFDSVIKKLMRGESPSVRDAIQATSCFGRMWFDPGDKTYCPETECAVRSLCEVAYHQAMESVEDELLVAEEIEELEGAVTITEATPRPKATGPLIGQKKKRANRVLSKKEKKARAKQKKVIKGGKIRSTRTPYIDQGRPVDKFAKMIWTQVGTPPELPPNWGYCSVGSLEDRTYAQGEFIKKFSGHLVVSRRAGYHQYFSEGLHVIRFWVNAAGHGNVDMAPAVSEEMKKLGFLVKVTPVKDKKHRFNFYPDRTRINCVEDAIELATAIMAALPKLELR